MIAILALSITLNACTITMLNTSTSGKAQDSVDAESDAQADVKPEVTIPSSII